MCENKHFASYEVQTVIRFRNIKGCNATDIHLQLCEMYVPTTVNEGKVRQWCCELGNAIQMFTMKRQVTGLASL